MSNSIRFLGVAVLAWAGVRAASLAFFPGATTVGVVPPAAASPLPAVAQTQFDPPPPPDPVPQAAYYPRGSAAYPTGYPNYPAYAAPPAQRVVIVPAGWSTPPGPAPRSAYAGGWAGIMPTPQPVYYVGSQGDPWPLRSTPAPAATRSAGQAPAAFPTMATPLAARFDRVQLSAWALLRGSRLTVPPTSLAPGGTLGGSQAGARLTYRFSNSWAVSLRSSSSVGGVRGAEVAGGIRWQPFASVPVALTAERRQRLGRYGGRSAFSLFAEGGLYHRPLFGGLFLDGYVQGGVVGLKRRDLFVDGGATLTRPIWRKFSGGIGLWGAAQPGLYRLDAGPRLTMDMGRGIKVHADYRQRLIGNAAPPSGPALTLAADF